MFVYSYDRLESESGLLLAFDYKNGGSLVWGKEYRLKEAIKTLLSKDTHSSHPGNGKRNLGMISSCGPLKVVARNPKESGSLGTTANNPKCPWTRQPEQST